MLDFSEKSKVKITDLQTFQIVNEIANFLNKKWVVYTPLAEYEIPTNFSTLDEIFVNNDEVSFNAEASKFLNDYVLPFGQNLLSGGEYAANACEEKMEEFYLRIYKKFVKNKSVQNTRWIKFRLWLTRQTHVMFWSEDLEPFWLKTKTRKELRAEIENTKI